MGRPGVSAATKREHAKAIIANLEDAEQTREAVHDVLDEYARERLEETPDLNPSTLKKQISDIKKIISTDFNKDDKWGWMLEDPKYFVSPVALGETSDNTLAVRLSMWEVGLYQLDLCPMHADIARVFATPLRFDWRVWCIAIAFACGKRFCEYARRERNVTLNPANSVSAYGATRNWEGIGKGNPPHPDNRCIFPAAQVKDLIDRLRDVLDSVPNSGTLIGQWFRSRALREQLPAVYALRYGFEHHFREVDSESAHFTSHDMRQPYVSWLNHYDGRHERSFAEYASVLLGHNPGSSAGRSYSWIQHCPAVASAPTLKRTASIDSEIGSVHDDETDCDKENVVTRAVKKAKSVA